MEGTIRFESRGGFLLGLLICLSFCWKGCANETPISELEKRKGIVYHRNSATPFTGNAVTWYGSDRKQKKSLTGYADGLIDGIETTWYKNGEPMSRKTYVNGRLHGESVLWYGNGRKKSVETFKNGKKIGRQRYWKKDGSIVKDIMRH